jgi:hypothetical protein
MLGRTTPRGRLSRVREDHGAIQTGSLLGVVDLVPQLERAVQVLGGLGMCVCPAGLEAGPYGSLTGAIARLPPVVGDLGRDDGCGAAGQLGVGFERQRAAGVQPRALAR